jgi:hypothetical protein
MRLKQERSLLKDLFDGLRAVCKYLLYMLVGCKQTKNQFLNHPPTFRTDTIETGGGGISQLIFKTKIVVFLFVFAK